MMDSRLIKVLRHIDEKNYKQALALVPSVLAASPDDPLVYLAWSICEAGTGHESKACEVLEAALAKFPDDSSILYALAETLKQLDRLDEAEKMYRLSIRKSPADRQKDKSEAWNGLGVVLWNQGRRPEALDAWRQALHHNPENRLASENLKNLSDDKGNPRRDGPPDDFSHFRQIATDAYLHRKGYSKFQTMEEAKRAIEAIIEIWNREIAPHHRKMDAMKPEDRTAWFRKVAEKLKQ